MTRINQAEAMSSNANNKKRKAEDQMETDDDNQQETGDGSGAGGKAFQLRSWSSAGSHKDIVVIEKRKFIQCRNLTPMCNKCEGFQSWHFPHGATIAWIPPSGNIADNICNAAGTMRIIGAKIRLSNLIMTQDELVLGGGTATTVTTFNTSPYVMVLRDTLGQLQDIPRKNQKRLDNDTGVITNIGDTDKWTLNDFETSGTVVENGLPWTKAGEVTYWKMGDDALEFNYDFADLWVNTLYHDSKAYMPMMNWEDLGFLKSKNIHAFALNKIYPLYISLPKVSTASGNFKFNFQFTLETMLTVEYKKTGMMEVHNMRQSLGAMNQAIADDNYKTFATDIRSLDTRNAVSFN